MNKSSERTKSRIIRAAAETFSAQGFRATTVREICGKAGANVAAINYHFGSKEKLYIETYRHVFADSDVLRLTRQPLRVRSHREWRQAWLRFSRALIDQITSPRLTHIWQCRMFSRERSEPSVVLPLLLEEFFLPIRTRVDELLRLGLAPNVDATTLLTWNVSVIAQCTVYAQREPPWDSLLIPQKMARAQWVTRVATHVVDGITGRLRFRGAAPCSATPPRRAAMERPRP